MDLERSQALGPPSSSGPGEQGLKVWSCVTCRRRKVKCDRKDPCANCIRNNIECHFPVTGRLPRRSRDPFAWKPPAQKQSELLGRLRRLENLVTELTGQVEDESGQQPTHGQPIDSTSSHATGQVGRGDNDTLMDGRTSSSASVVPELSTGEASTTESQTGGEIYEDFGKLVIGRAGALQVEKGFWSIFCDEVQHIFEAIHDESYAGQEGKPPSQISQDTSQTEYQCHAFAFGGPCMSEMSSLDELSPLPSQMLYIWKSYVDNVDPFIKILHIPTMDSIVFQLRGKFSSLGHSMEALLFAISLASVVSLEEEEAMDSFRVPKRELISRFRLCTERALAHSQFLISNDITVFRALVIYVSILPHIGEQKLASSLAGSLVRIAASLKLHVDPDNARLNVPLDPIEAECRRRLWWQVCFIDSRTKDSNLPGTSISESSFNTKRPSIVDDTQLRTGSPRVEASISSPSVMTLTAIRCENWALYRSIRQRPDDPLEIHLGLVREAQGKLEATYLQYLRPDNDFDNLVKTMSTLFFAKIEQGIHRHFLRLSATNNTGESPSYDPNLLAIFFNLSVTILETTHALRTNQAWHRWRWQLQGRFPWHTVGAVFMQLCQLPWTPVSEKAWNLAWLLIDELPPDSRKEGLWDRLNRLASKASSHRDSQIAKEQAGQYTPENALAPAPNEAYAQPPANVELLGNITGATDIPGGISGSENNWILSWMTTGENNAFDFYDDATFSAIVEGALPSGEVPDVSLYGMTGVPTEWQDWDDLLMW